MKQNAIRKSRQTHNSGFNASFNNGFKSKGFSLVEMAIVLVIFGLVIGGMMGPIKIQLDAKKLRDTQATIETSKKALIGYALRNGRLPCPDTDADGAENRSGTNCSSARGDIPYATLGVNALDAWKQVLSYRVDTQFADSTDGTGCPDTDVVGISFEICSNGNIRVLSNAGGNVLASDVPAIVVSHGKNWASSGDSDEQENSDNDTDFVDKNHIHQGYDDVVGWVNINELISALVNAGQLP